VVGKRKIKKLALETRLFLIEFQAMKLLFEVFKGEEDPKNTLE
jgi:hypothetical protein